MPTTRLSSRATRIAASKSRNDKVLSSSPMNAAKGFSSALSTNVPSKRILSTVRSSGVYDGVPLHVAAMPTSIENASATRIPAANKTPNAEANIILKNCFISIFFR